MCEAGAQACGPVGAGAATCGAQACGPVRALLPVTGAGMVAQALLEASSQYAWTTVFGAFAVQGLLLLAGGAYFSACEAGPAGPKKDVVAKPE
eukprot:COSAG06_NODE_1527_length_9194_cov_19.780539_4_plen_93_part_00